MIDSADTAECCYMIADSSSTDSANMSASEALLRITLIQLGVK
jgi:hypothetical protein